MNGVGSPKMSGKELHAAIDKLAAERGISRSEAKAMIYAVLYGAGPRTATGRLVTAQSVQNMLNMPKLPAAFRFLVADEKDAPRLPQGHLLTAQQILALPVGTKVACLNTPRNPYTITGNAVMENGTIMLPLTSAQGEATRIQVNDGQFDAGWRLHSYAGDPVEESYEELIKRIGEL